MLNRRQTIAGLGLATMPGLAAPALAQSVSKIGLVLPMTGPFASTGRQIEAATKLYLAQNSGSFGGRRIELIVRDDTGTADVTRRIAQELIVNEKVAFISGFGLTPLAFAAAPLASQSKTPMVVMAAATSAVTEQSPYIARTSFTLPQATIIIADWAAQNGLKKAMTIVTDYAPGLDAERAFRQRFPQKGGELAGDALRVPIRNPDFAPFLQRVADTKPDALFVFVPSGVGAQFMKQFVERGLDKAGIRLIGTGDVTDDDILNEIGDAALGVVTSFHYSAAHPSPENQAFVRAFRAANPSMRPNFMAVGGYDGMHLMAETLKKTNGGDGTQLIEAAKGMSWVSPRGPVTIEAKTRDITQNIYVRRVERVDGQLYNVEFATFEAVPDPVKGR
jgi:branched-chain amino acid transport system substrate-binding protein